MFSKRHQDLWKNRSNNACLLVNPIQNDVQNIYSFCQHFNDSLSQFVFTSMQITKILKFDEPIFVVDTQENISMIIEILKQQRFIFLDVISQIKGSYKGYVSWLIIGTNSRLYLIDAGRLHDKCYELKQALQRKQLIKFMHQCQEVLFTLKRDWQIFLPNIFDLQIIQRYLAKKGKSNLQPRLNLKQFLTVNTQSINSRPIRTSLLNQIQSYYESQITYLLHMDKFFASEDPQYQCYAYFNHYEFLLKSYFHHIPTVKQMDELQKVKRGVSIFFKYGHHQEVDLAKQEKKQNSFWIKDIEEEQMAQVLCDWREHIAKMRDINSEQVLSYQTISMLSKTKINSILQISQICTSQSSTFQGIYNLSLQQFEQIFELFQLYRQQKQEVNHQLVIPRRLPYYKTNQEKPIKQLFEDLKFTEVGNDWLNKKTDESVRLYKQIVSINEFDNSIVEQYVKELSLNSPSSLSLQDINRYVKYAEYLRLGNHKRLQQLYERSKTHIISQSSSVEQEYFQENFIQGQQYKNWDQIQEEINFPTMDTINHVKSTQSVTSLKNLTNLEIQSCKTLFNPKSTIILKQKKLNSLHLLESPSMFNKIEPLPENIEAIYLQAAKAKKNYAAKGQKKNNKVGKKQSKTLIESKCKKEQQFVPKKQEIFNLIYY